MIRVHPVHFEFDIGHWFDRSQAERLLQIYVDTINRSLAVKTRMRLAFDGDIRVVPLLDSSGRFISQPQTLHTYPDEHDYRVCFYNSETQPGLHATHGVDTNGDAVICCVNFGLLIDPSSWVGHWQHCRTAIHELGHTRGLAAKGGESYNGTDASDDSGDEPLSSVFVYRQPDPYWVNRMERYKSPMCSVLTPGHPIYGMECTSLDWCIANNTFTNHEAKIINGHYRAPNPLPPTLNQNAIRVITNTKARIRVWSAPRNWSSGVWELIHEADNAIETVFAWHTLGWNRPNACVKVVAPGCAPKAEWVSLFDLEEAAMRGAAEPFTVPVFLSPPPPPRRPPWESDPRWPGAPWWKKPWLIASWIRAHPGVSS